MKRTTLLPLGVALLAALASAQDLEPQVEPGSGPAPSACDPATVLPAAISAWRTPIHTAPDDPLGGYYGIWAAGPDYKVSFHDGISFYPVLGEAYPENLPLTWRTESLRAGGREWLSAGSLLASTFTAWRFERRYPGVIEAYDVLERGVEQTFTLLQPPPRPGDLVISSRIATRLRAEPVADRQGEVTFCDESGHALVTYGEALAYDATGARSEVRTSFDGEMLRLNLDVLQALVILCTGSASSGGGMRCTVPLPDVPHTSGVVYLQWLQLSPSATFVTTRGLRTVIH